MLEARDVGPAIRELRGERSQASLAEEADLDPGALRSYEEGRDIPPRDVLVRLIESFGISEPEFDLKVIDYWRKRIGEELPQSLEGKRLELIEHMHVLGIRFRSMVKTIDDIALLHRCR